MNFIECLDNNIWNDFVVKAVKNQYVTIAHNPSLGPILSKTFGYKYKNILIKDESKIVGVIPIIFIRNKIVSMPHFSYGGPLVEFGKGSNVDLNLFMKNRKYELRSFDKLSTFFNSNKVTCFLKLKESKEDQWMNFKSKLRNSIRKSKKFDLILKRGGLELLNDFYLVYSNNMLRLGSPPLGKLFFKNLLDDYRFGRAEISTVYLESQPVAVGFTLSYQNFNEVCWASADYSFNKYNVNMFLYWGMIKSSIEEGYEYFSFGRTTINSATHRFKRAWDPIDVPVYFNFSEKKKGSIKNNKFLGELWKLQPLRTSVFFGRIISKYVY